MPENQLLEPHFKQSIGFNILCPISECKEIKANGFDSKFEHPVQLYKCKVHGRNFYVHTSWLMKELAEIVVRRILLLIFTGSVPGNEIAEGYKLSAQTLSKQVNQCEKYVDSEINIIKNSQGISIV